MSKKHLPPYGRDLKDRTKAAAKRGTFCDEPMTSPSGQFADVIVFCGPRGFTYASRDTRLKLCLKHGERPKDYLWPVKGFNCAIWHCGNDYDPTLVSRIGAQLVAAGARIVISLEGGVRFDG